MQRLSDWIGDVFQVVSACHGTIHRAKSSSVSSRPPVWTSKGSSVDNSWTSLTALVTVVSAQCENIPEVHCFRVQLKCSVLHDAWWCGQVPFQVIWHSDQN